MSEPAAYERERVPSNLISSILTHAQHRRMVNVLDLGLGAGQTIKILAEQKPCRFYFADIGRHIGVGYENISRGLLQFRLPPRVKLDICLFWDYLNLMSDDVFRQFAKELDRLIGKQTLIHAFIASSIRQPMSYKRFAIADNDNLESLDPVKYIARYPKLRQEFEEVFPHLRITRAVRYHGNRQEILASIG